MSKENKVYFFHNEDGIGWYFGAKSFKSAKSMALVSSRCNTDFMDNPFVDIRGRMCRNHYPNGEWDKKGEVIRTEIEGELTTQQTVDLGLAWWNCMECGSDNFEIEEDDEHCICGECGEYMEIPYA